MSTVSFDQAKAEAFAGKMIGALNGGSLVLMASIGHHVGLFDTMENQPPLTSNQIAEKANLNERYVREWLSAMATGRIVEYNPTDQTFCLPPEHAMWLTTKAGMNNIATFAQFFPVMAQVEDNIVECFRHGGGVPYSAYKNFHRVMAGLSDVRNDQILIDQILPVVPGLTERLKEGIEVLEVGCGRGHATNLMARSFPKSRFTAYDFSEGCIAIAQQEAQTIGLTNVVFKAKDVSQLNHRHQFGLVTAFDVIHDQANPDVVLSVIEKALQADGVFLMLDIRAATPLAENMDHMLGPALYTISTTHCMTVSLAQNGSGLGAMWGRQQAEKMLQEAGFGKVEVKQVPQDLFNDYYVVRMVRKG